MESVNVDKTIELIVNDVERFISWRKDTGQTTTWLEVSILFSKAERRCIRRRVNSTITQGTVKWTGPQDLVVKIP